MFRSKFSAATVALLFATSSVAFGAEKAELAGNIYGHKGAIESLQFAEDGNALLSGSRDGTARIWDMNSGRLMRQMGRARYGVSDALYSPDNRVVLTTGSKGSVLIWDVASGKQISALHGGPGKQLCLDMSSDGEFVVVGGASSQFAIWRVQDGQPLHVIQGHEGPIKHAVFSPDSQYCATVGEDGGIRVWEVLTGYLAFSMRADEPLNCVKFDPKGQNMAVAGDQVTLFALRSGKILRKFKGHGGPVRCVEFSPNGKFLASGSDDKTAKIWSVSTGRLIDTLQQQEGSISSLAFSPDGLYLATGSEKFIPAQGKPVGENSIAVWNLVEVYSDNRISLHVERELYHWSRKGEFEKLAAYEARMATEHIQTGKFFTEAFRKFENDIREGVSLSLYDVEREEYTITLPTLGSFQVHVPLAKAREFKQHFSDMVYRNFIVEPSLQVPGGSTWELKRVEIFCPSMKQSFFFGEAS